MIACIVVGIGLLTNPAKEEVTDHDEGGYFLLIGAEGEILYVVPEDATDEQIADMVGSVPWLLAPTTFEIAGDDVISDENLQSGDTAQGDSTPTAVKWTYSPMMSATWHVAFHFNIGLENYTHIEASCSNGIVAAGGRKLGKVSGHLVLYVRNEEVSVEKAAEILLEVKRLMDAGGVSFYAIDLVLEYPRAEDGTKKREGRVETMDFLYADIYEEGLAERVNAANDAATAYYEKMDAENEKVTGGIKTE